MNNHDVARELTALGNLMVMAGEDETKAARFLRLAHVVTVLSEPVATLCREGRLSEIAGVGPHTAALLSEYVATGTCRKRREIERRVSVNALELLTIPGIGARTARTLVQECGIDSLNALEIAAQSGKIRGVDTRTATKLRNFLRFRSLQKRNETLSLWSEGEREFALSA